MMDTRQRISDCEKIGLGLLLSLTVFLVATWADPEKKVYPFRRLLLEGLELVARLEPLQKNSHRITAEEIAFFQNLKEARVKDGSLFADAALLASGVTDSAKRKTYRQTLDQVSTGARKWTDAVRTPAEKGEALLKYLHRGPMAKGYSGKQTTLSGILDHGEYNCVSSAVLYALVAQTLNLEVRGIEIPGTWLPGHVFIVLRDGDRWIDVETTNPRGFDPRGKRKTPDGGEFDPNKQQGDRRQVDPLGMAALIYYNRGVDEASAKRYLDAVRLDLAALALDPSSPSAAGNLRGALVRWGNQLRHEEQFASGLEVVAVGLELDPQDDNLQKLRSLLWLDHARSLFKAGKEKEAVALLTAAGKAIPKSDFAEDKAALFLRPAEQLVKTGAWDQALALAQRGESVVDDKKAREVLSRWRINTFFQWAATLRKQGDWQQAADILARAYKEFPNDYSLNKEILYHTQEWIAQADTQGGSAKASAVLSNMSARFPAIKELPGLGKNHVYRKINGQLRDKHYAEAQVLLTKYQDLLPEPPRPKGTGRPDL